MINASSTESKVLQSFYEIVPEAKGEDIRQELSLREQFEMDSIDFLNFIIKLHQTFQIDIPEADYRQLTTLSKIVAYVSGKQKKTV